MPIQQNETAFTDVVKRALAVYAIVSEERSRGKTLWLLDEDPDNKAGAVQVRIPWD